MVDGETVTPEQAKDSSMPVWQRAHQALVGLAKRRGEHDLEEGRWLRAAAQARVDRRLGYGSFVEYVERLFGYAPRLTHEKLRVAEALEGLPELAAALEKGETNWSSVRELTRVATLHTEQKWLEVARGRTVREVERLVSGRNRGSLPTDQADPNLERHVLRFEVSGEVMATFRDAMAKLRRDAGGALDDDAALLLMARHVLGGPVEAGRASYQLELTVCESCRTGWQHGQGETVVVGEGVADMARCDAQHLTAHSVSELNAATHLDGPSKRRARAEQDVPPARRREVLRRDRHRCVVPGCRHSSFLDVHHILTREEGGAHDADNLITLCGAHHRTVHQGELRIEGRVSIGLRYSHADGTDYGSVSSISGSVADAHSKAFQALRQLGFAEREARGALSSTDSQVGAIVLHA